VAHQQTSPSQPAAISSTQLRQSQAQMMTLPNVPSTFQIPPSSHRPIPSEARDRPVLGGYRSPPKKGLASPPINRSGFHAHQRSGSGSGSSGSDGGAGHVGGRYAEENSKAVRVIKTLFEDRIPL
jgi:hypothetical protein